MSYRCPKFLRQDIFFHSNLYTHPEFCKIVSESGRSNPIHSMNIEFQPHKIMCCSFIEKALLSCWHSTPNLFVFSLAENTSQMLRICRTTPHERKPPK